MLEQQVTHLGSEHEQLQLMFEQSARIHGAGRRH